MSVYDGCEMVIRRSQSVNKIMEVMFSVDDEVLYFYRGTEASNWARLIYGNDGWDVVADHSCRDDSSDWMKMMSEHSDYANKIADECY